MICILITFQNMVLALGQCTCPLWCLDETSLCAVVVASDEKTSAKLFQLRIATLQIYLSLITIA